MSANNFYDTQLINSAVLRFISKKLKEEKFEKVSSFIDKTKEKFRGILEDFLSGRIDLDKVLQTIQQEIEPPPEFKKVGQWQERLVRTEISKIFTVGYGDYLLSLGETECFISHSLLDESEECLQLITTKRPSLWSSD